jgi:hypothetical protein
MSSYGSMIDCTGAALVGVLAAIGTNYPSTLAGYVTGTGGVDWTTAQWDMLAGVVGLFRYDQSPALGMFASGAADCADVEASAGSLIAAVAAAKIREAKGWYSWIYLSYDNLATAREAVATAALKSVKFGVADYNLSQLGAEAFLTDNADVAFVQWAAPSSNPSTLCPGSSKTLSELNCDLNVTRPNWFVKPVPVAPVTTVKGVVVTEDLVTYFTTSTDRKTWTV